MIQSELLRVLETALLCTPQPLDGARMERLLDGAVARRDIENALAQLQRDWAPRGIELVHTAAGWRFQSRADLRPFLARLDDEKAPRYSRAVLEVLAVIAYRQPVTRGDIEEVRGVSSNASLLRQLEERGWIEITGQRESIGRPALYGTTRQFLDDLGLQSLAQLPPLPGSGPAAGMGAGAHDGGGAVAAVHVSPLRAES